MWQDLSMRERAETALLIRRAQKQWVADQMGIHHTAISRVLRWMDIPESGLMVRTLRSFCRVLNLRLAWLLDGDGEMDAVPGLDIYAKEKAGEARIVAPPAVQPLPLTPAIPASVRHRKRGP